MFWCAESKKHKLHNAVELNAMSLKVMLTIIALPSEEWAIFVLKKKTFFSLIKKRIHRTFLKFSFKNEKPFLQRNAKPQFIFYFWSIFCFYDCELIRAMPMCEFPFLRRKDNCFWRLIVLCNLFSMNWLFSAYFLTGKHFSIFFD